MRNLFHFEHRRQPLASPSAFSARLVRNGLWASVVVLVSLAIGIAGYMGLEGMSFIDALLNAAMILSGMGPVQPLVQPGAKIFASLYAIASGLLLFAVAGLILAPIYHRLLHRFHVEESGEGEAAAPSVKAQKRGVRKAGG